MHNILIILLLLLFWSCTACNSNNPDSDSDTSEMDSDIVVKTDDDSQDFDQDSQEEQDEEKDVTQDNATDSDTAEKSDYDYPVGIENDFNCPSLYSPGFPNYDDKGKITFCRKCDLPAPANDPQCVRNLWEMNNRRIMEEYPERYCYPLPCDITEKASPPPVWINEKCDVDSMGRIYHNSTGVFKQGDIWEGKIGMYATAGKSIDGKYIVIGSLLYEIETGKYTMVAWADSKQAYKYDRFIFLAGNTYDYQSYILSAHKVENGWKYEVAYTNEQKKVEFLYPPAVGKNYVLINVTRSDTTSAPREILYASVKDWKWTKLGEGVIYYPQIHEDTAFFAYNGNVWACDLTKSSTNIETDCRKVNREGEKATSPAVKKGNKNLIIYTAESGYQQLYMADLSVEDIVYTKLDLEKSSDLISFSPGQWDGDILALDELYQYSEVDIDYRTCYYSISKNKKVCFPNSKGGRMGYIYAGVEGKYITYQPTGALILKDMECYCKEYPDQCLYDEYMPDEAPVYVY